jgi:hypothetical protein
VLAKNNHLDSKIQVPSVPAEVFCFRTRVLSGHRVKVIKVLIGAENAVSRNKKDNAGVELE